MQLHEAFASGIVPPSLDVSLDAGRASALGQWCENPQGGGLHRAADRAAVEAVHREVRLLARRLVDAVRRGEAGAARHYAALSLRLAQLDDLLFVLLHKSVEPLAGAWRLGAAAFDHCDDGVMVLDPQRTVVYVNPAFCVSSGGEPDQLLGMPLPLLDSWLHDAVALTRSAWATVEAEGVWRGEAWRQRKDGERYLARIAVRRVSGATGVVSHYLLTLRDMSGVHLPQDQLDRLAYYDALTALPNRVLYGERLAQALALARRQGQMVAVLFIDLDRFKPINDTLGHSAGDAVLVEVAHRLTGVLRESDTAARLSGDEFAVVLTTVRSLDDALVAARRINDLLTEPFIIAGRELIVVASIGVALFPEHGEEAQALTQAADAAMYDAKRQGGNRYRVYRPALKAANAQLFAMGNGLRRALEREEFILHYQPLVRLDSGHAVGMEALLRWQHPEQGLLKPASFLPIAEQTGSMVEIGDWVLRRACRDAKGWQREVGFRIPVSVNVSSRQLGQRDFAERVAMALEESQLDPEWLCLEISEAAMLDDHEHTAGLLRQLKSIGVRLAVDNFGKGQSGFAYLRRFPVDTLKIDQSLFRGVAQKGREHAFAKAVFDLARALELSVVAEGVETLEQLLFVKRYVNGEAQGFYFAEPVPAGELLPLLRSWQADTAQG
jgi:diguanylate cyclase (GGDEF)-like protein/PAS domain S-box-containing protein